MMANDLAIPLSDTSDRPGPSPARGEGNVRRHDWVSLA